MQPNSLRDIRMFDLRHGHNRDRPPPLANGRAIIAVTFAGDSLGCRRGGTRRLQN